MTTENKEESIYCPFCLEDDFDIYGLQLHLINHDCCCFGKYNSRNELAKEPNHDH